MEKVLFVLAMEKEAKPIIEKLNLKFANKNTYRNGKYSLLIVGIGKQKTAINLTRYLENSEKPDIIVNIGYCGSNNLDIGSIVNVRNAMNYEWYIPGEEKYKMLDFGNQTLDLINEDKIKKVNCYSSESFVTATNIVDVCVFDMELHSIAIICDIYNIKLMSLKKVSDNMSLDNYYKNLKRNDIGDLSDILELIKDL